MAQKSTAPLTNIPKAVPIPDVFPLSDWLEAVKEASKTLRVPLPRRQAAALRRISAELEPKTGRTPVGQ